ncbi:phosphoheptose isomerase [Methylacidiphilum sp. Yel]|jgi:mannose-6-phosphate isomerase|uniref:type I phosphomannose isomerase catalytic subunit n=1 Tax=Methylacidiphilum sp. Yel TaxID=1847730 RepID=UPI00106C59C0|nr:type I phosphomannose isomerase catalytic subunit [Methylacidiphilum sp. Yel]TFE68985.1 phosphoheptose isomerase [Methylacidiphilum sp. Yel]
MGIFQFHPIYKKKIWGGGLLNQFVAGKDSESFQFIGESWQLVDREKECNVLKSPYYSMRNLHDLWVNQKEEIFGRNAPPTTRFPLIVKILDCRLPTSIQVHPGEKVATQYGWEKKTEFWFFLATLPGSSIYLGFKQAISPNLLKELIGKKAIIQYLNHIPTFSSHGILVLSGQIHAIGGGNLILEIQDNSDTTFRIYDWERPNENGSLRPLHYWESVLSLSLEPNNPKLLRPEEISVEQNYFAVKRIELKAGQFYACHMDGASFLYLLFCSGRVVVGDILYDKGQGIFVSANHGKLEVVGVDTKNEFIAVSFPLEK